MTLANHVARVARVALAEDHLARSNRAARRPRRSARDRPRSSVEKREPPEQFDDLRGASPHRQGIPQPAAGGGTGAAGGRRRYLRRRDLPHADCRSSLRRSRALGGARSTHPSRGRPRAPHPATARRCSCARRELWATIDVCNPADQPTPWASAARCRATDAARPDVHELPAAVPEPHHRQWCDLAPGQHRVRRCRRRADRAPGRASFQLKPTAGQAGVHAARIVDFQWRRAATSSWRRSEHRGTQEPRRSGPGRLQRRSCVIMAEQPGVVGDDAVDAHGARAARSCARRRPSRRRAPRRPGYRADQPRCDYPPVGHDRVEAARRGSPRARAGSVAR